MNPFNLNILVVEDNYSFALELQMLLEKLNYNVIDRVDNAADALEIIFSKSPDLILMDIHIKGNLSGVEIGEKIKHLNIPILYITSIQDETYYRAAQKSNMLGYLLKPIEKISLRTTLELAIAKAYHLKTTAKELATPESKDNFIAKDSLFVKKNGVYHKVKISEIAFVKSDENYCRIVNINGGEFIIRITLSKIEKLLPPTLFLKIHRQYIVQIEHISTIDFNDGMAKVNNLQIPISRAKRKYLAARINKLES